MNGREEFHTWLFGQWKLASATLALPLLGNKYVLSALGQVVPAVQEFVTNSEPKLQFLAVCANVLSLLLFLLLIHRYEQWAKRPVATPSEHVADLESFWSTWKCFWVVMIIFYLIRAIFTLPYSDHRLTYGPAGLEYLGVGVTLAYERANAFLLWTFIGDSFTIWLCYLLGCAYFKLFLPEVSERATRTFLSSSSIFTSMSENEQNACVARELKQATKNKTKANLNYLLIFAILCNVGFGILTLAQWEVTNTDIKQAVSTRNIQYLKFPISIHSDPKVARTSDVHKLRAETRAIEARQVKFKKLRSEMSNMPFEDVLRYYDLRVAYHDHSSSPFSEKFDSYQPNSQQNQAKIRNELDRLLQKHKALAALEETITEAERDRSTPSSKSSYANDLQLYMRDHRLLAGLPPLEVYAQNYGGWTLIVDSNSMSYMFLCDAIANTLFALAIALFVGRLESRLLQVPSWLVASLYLYAMLQIFLLFTDYATSAVPAQSKSVLIMSAAVMKWLLFFVVCWLAETGSLEYYLMRMRQRGESQEDSWLEFRKDLQAMGEPTQANNEPSG